MLGKVLDIILTVINNFKLFPFQIACKCPVYFSRNMGIVKAKRGSVILKGPISTHMIYLGKYGTDFINSNKGFFKIDKGGKIIFQGKATFGEGFRVYVSNGILKVGSNVYSNKNLTLQCEQKVQIEDNALLGWNISIRDTDGHKTKNSSKFSINKKRIIIGKNSWIAADVTILKGSVIPSGSIVACNSVVLENDCFDENSLIAGYPAKEKRKNIQRLD